MSNTSKSPAKAGVLGLIAMQLLGLAGFVLLVALFVEMRYRVVGISEDIATLKTEQQARGVVQNFYTTNRYRVPELLCADGKDTSLCQMVTYRTYDNLGQHTDLWVLYDAATRVSESQMPGGKQRELVRIFADLAKALNTYQALDMALQEDSFPEVLMANELYVATVAQAMVCREMLTSVPCTHGLPPQVVAALKRLAVFLQVEGPTVAPYDMRLRQPAIDDMVLRL